MAFSNMGGGADCSAGANPMSQMLKQFNQDRSLQRVRFTFGLGE
jgi:peroxin-5